MHASPHVVQFVSVPIGVSQPSPYIVLQSRKPVVHDAMPHVLDTHCDVAFGAPGHALHEPQ